MDQLLEVIKLIFNGVDNPILAIAGVVASLLGYIFYRVLKQKWRMDKAEKEKQKDKVKDQDKLEEKEKDSDSSVRDRLNNRK